MGSRGRKSRAELEIVPPTTRLTTAMVSAEPPAHLGEAGAAFYRKMLQETDISGADELAHLTRASECLDRIAAAQASIAEHGEITVNQYNQPKLNPACNLEKQARDGFFAAMRMLDIQDDAPKADRYGHWRR
jgi:phage terminase small subunit